MRACDMPISVTRRLRHQMLPGFDDIGHYWDSKHQLYAARIRPGEYYVTSTNELISTVLGSCISACIRDPKCGIGGMNHFMLPHSATAGDGGYASTAARYGSYAMEHLINKILAHGGERARLETKLFGGGRMLRTITDVGSSNIAFVHDYLRTETLLVSAEDLGGIHPRKVLYFPETGRVLVR